jgi:hypothetical protein
MKVQAAKMPERNRLNSNSEFSREAEKLTIPATIATRTRKGFPKLRPALHVLRFRRRRPAATEPFFICHETPLYLHVAMKPV